MYMIGAVTKYGYSKEMMFYQWIGLATILFVLPSKRYTIETNLKNKMISSKCISFVLDFVLIYLVIAILMFISGGYSNKNDIYANGNIFIRLSFNLAYFAILLYAYELYEELYESGKVLIWNMVKSVGVIVLFGFASGERDYMFTVVMLTILLMFLFGKIKRSVLFACIPAGVIILPLSNSFKYFVLTGKVSAVFDINNLLVEFLDGEFISAGRNLQILINNHCENYFGGKSVLNDFIRVFFTTSYSNQTWFNDSFFPSVNSTQYGFSMVGEGYVNGGVLGIVLIYIFLGCLLRYLYISASKSQYKMMIYLYMLPLFVYATRADLANVLSPLLKYALLGTGLIMIMDRMSLRKETK